MLFFNLLFLFGVLLILIIIVFFLIIFFVIKLGLLIVLIMILVFFKYDVIFFEWECKIVIDVFFWSSNLEIGCLIIWFCLIIIVFLFFKLIFVCFNIFMMLSGV